MRWATCSLFSALIVVLLLLKQGESFINPVWMSVFYFYGLGIPVYLYASYFVFRCGAVNWSSRTERLWFYMIHIGFFCVCSIHIGWTWFALHSPYRGGL